MKFIVNKLEKQYEKKKKNKDKTKYGSSVLF